MCTARQIFKHATYLITRRRTQRQLLLKPSPRMKAIFRYCLAAAAKKYGVLVHTYVVLSNHYHAVVTDLKGNIPLFMAYLHRLVAACTNVSIG